MSIAVAMDDRRDGVEEGQRSSPVSARIASARAGEVSGPVAMMTLSQSAGGRPAISLALDRDQRMASSFA
jgi:hypothetical protein